VPVSRMARQKVVLAGRQGRGAGRGAECYGAEGREPERGRESEGTGKRPKESAEAPPPPAATPIFRLFAVRNVTILFNEKPAKR